MKFLIAAGLALSLLSGTAAEAAPYFRHIGPVGGPYPVYAARHGVFVGPRHHVWVRGQYLSPRFGRYVVVADWHRYRLHRPPRGYHWVRYGDDFLLAAIATGFIADVILHSHY